VSGEGAPGSGDELRELVEALRRAILDLRSAIDEISNPIIPRPQAADRGDDSGAGAAGGAGEESGGSRPPQGGRGLHEAPGGSDSGGEPSKPTEPPAGVGFPRQRGPGNGGAALPALEAPAAPPASPRARPRLSLEKLAGLLRLAYELQSRVPAEYLAGMVDILHDSGLISSRQREALRRLIEIARTGYEHGVGVDESIAILAAIARELGIDVSAVTEELVKAVLRRRGGESWGSPQQ